MTATATRLPPLADWPLYWFSRLENAVEAGDHADAAEAQRQLSRLGVDVRYAARAARAARLVMAESNGHAIAAR